jgi:hypothetical protein
MEEARRIQQQYDIIFCHGDTIARYASNYAGLAKNREDTLIIGLGALPGRQEGLELLRNNDIDATIARPPLVDLALRILVKKSQDKAFQPKGRIRGSTPARHAQKLRSGPPRRSLHAPRAVKSSLAKGDHNKIASSPVMLGPVSYRRS